MFAARLDLIAALRGTKMRVGEAQPWLWAVGQTLQYAGLEELRSPPRIGLLPSQSFSVTAVTALGCDLKL